MGEDAGHVGGSGPVDEAEEVGARDGVDEVAFTDFLEEGVEGDRAGMVGVSGVDKIYLLSCSA